MPAMPLLAPPLLLQPMGLLLQPMGLLLLPLLPTLPLSRPALPPGSGSNRWQGRLCGQGWQMLAGVRLLRM